MTSTTKERGVLEWRSGSLSLRVTKMFGRFFVLVDVGNRGYWYAEFTTRTAAINEGMRLFRKEGAR